MSPLTSVSRGYDVAWGNNCVIISEWRPSWSAILDFWFVQILQKPSKVGSKVIKTIKNTIKWYKDLKNATRKLALIFSIREIEILKKLPVKIWLPWKRQVTWAVTCYIKLLPNKFWKKLPSLVAFALILKKLLTSKVAAGRIRPPPPGLNRVKVLTSDFSTELPWTQQNSRDRVPLTRNTCPSAFINL